MLPAADVAVVANRRNWNDADPDTTELVSPLTKPLSTVSVKVGLAAPYSRDALLAVTVRWALPTVSVPALKVVKS